MSGQGQGVKTREGPTRPGPHPSRAGYWAEGVKRWIFHISAATAPLFQSCCTRRGSPRGAAAYPPASRYVLWCVKLFPGVLGASKCSKSGCVPRGRSLGMQSMSLEERTDRHTTAATSQTGLGARCRGRPCTSRQLVGRYRDWALGMALGGILRPGGPSRLMKTR